MPLSSATIWRFWRPVSRLSKRGVLGGHAHVPAHRVGVVHHVETGHRARPESGVARVVRIRTAVVLPAPLGPRTPRMEPAGTEKLTPARAWVSP